jgi:1,4-alpha-glucan branching enzyme
MAWGAAPAIALFVVVTAVLVGDRSALRQRFAEREVEVVYSAPQAVSVSVVGDFNAWNPKRTRMVRADHAGSWTARLRLPPGVHQYSFVVDGTAWVPDPGRGTISPTVSGSTNSILIVDG